MNFRRSSDSVVLDRRNLRVGRKWKASPVILPSVCHYRPPPADIGLQGFCISNFLLNSSKETTVIISLWSENSPGPEKKCMSKWWPDITCFQLIKRPDKYERWSFPRASLYLLFKTWNTFHSCWDSFRVSIRLLKLVEEKLIIKSPDSNSWFLHFSI